MWERRWGWTGLGVLALFLGWGGSTPALAFEAANRLLVQSIVPVTGGGGFVFNAVEKTDDSGGSAGEEGEGDGYPDPGEVIEAPLGNDLAKLTLKNEPRPGVEKGVDLTVYQVDITYLDASGNSRAFAARSSFQQSQLIPTGGTADLEFIIVPYSMKVPSEAYARGLRTIFLYPASPAEVDQVSRWTAAIDIWAKDKLNGDTVHARTDQTISFVNPNAQQ